LISASQYNYLYTLLLSYIKLGTKVLDWGCGNGHFSYFLIQSGYQTSGYAFSPRPSLEVLQSHDYKFFQGNDSDPVKLPYADETFDAVVSVGVLEHVRETGGHELDSLREISRILTMGGYFICYHLPNQFSWIEAISRLLPNKFNHAYRYIPTDIHNLCQESGLEVLELRAYGFLPRNFLGNLPSHISNSAQITRFYNVADNILSRLFSGLCQNYWFVARKQVR